MRSRLDVTSLVAGLLVIAVGGLLLAGRDGSIDITSRWVVPLVGIVVGTVLLASGLSRRWWR